MILQTGADNKLGEQNDKCGGGGGGGGGKRVITILTK